MRLGKLHKTPPTSWLFSNKPQEYLGQLNPNSLI
jgi:hypothetical protein